MIYSCCSLNRKSAILDTPGTTVNGIDYIEVSDQPSGPPLLLLHCLNTIQLSQLTAANVAITGGESITDITITSVTQQPVPQNNVLAIQPNQWGDFSTYLLRLVASTTDAAEDPFHVTEVCTGFDPQLAEVRFSFMLGCGPEFDCTAPSQACASPPATPPPINYLAKDYGSFRTLILDRLNTLLPTWAGTSEADLGIVLAELIAYQADHLSYQQDAIATEAYLETARSRVSLRRHARLVDYHVHDGCNARAWMQLTVAAAPHVPIFLDHTQTRFYTFAAGMPSTLAGNEEAALLCGVQVFEPMQDALLYFEHNQMNLYTWGDTECCLPEGATEATLDGYFPNLKPGDVLIFKEVLGPQTGQAPDADLRHRCAVRLTSVATTNAQGNPLTDPIFDSTGAIITDPKNQAPRLITEIQWSSEDALPFPVCISSAYLDSTGSHTATNVSVVLGNVVLADHGLSFTGTPIGTMPSPRIFFPSSLSLNRCQPPSLPVAVPARFRPILPDSPLTQQVPLPLAGAPAGLGVMPLGLDGSANLTDSNGLVCLTITATDSQAWPALFGILVTQNETTPANFDLKIQYLPPDGASGADAHPILEEFTNLSAASAPATINELSQLISVPASFTPPSTPPSGFPTSPTMLPNTGSIPLTDDSDPPVNYLVIAANNPTTWPQLFGVVVEAQEPSEAAQPATPTYSLAVVYYPPSGGVGVPLPVTLENYTGLSLSTIPQIGASSKLITATSFGQSPDIRIAATDLMNFDPDSAVPVIRLEGTVDDITTSWTAQQDLLANGPLDQVFVVEIELNGAASLRFATPADPFTPGETTNGKLPSPGTVFSGSYRIGNGTSGNLGAESLVNLATADARIQSCTNPLPATGGTDPETNDQIRRRAPQAFLSTVPGSLQRAITMQDYQAVAGNNSQVDQAVASLRWTGSWYSVFLAVEPQGGGSLTSSLQATLQNTVETCRLAGQDIQLQSPQYISLQITLQVQVAPNYFSSDVEQSLLQVLGSGILPTGQKGLFYPDNFTFGQTVFLSPVYAAARSVAGVLSVTATQFQPQGANSTQYLNAGQIKLGSLQVARLDNDPSYPDHGQLTLTMQGGK